MKYFLDTEFIENGITIDLMSIGIVCEDGRTFYRQNASCVFSKASDWVWRNVFPSLKHFNMKGARECAGMPVAGSLSNLRESKCSGKDCPWRDKYEIRNELKYFCDIEKFGKPEFWGYYADYDWVAFCQLFGTMMDLPKGFPMYCRDIKQLANSLGNPDMPKSDTNSDHNALSDAIEAKMRYEWLTRNWKIEIVPLA